jgi:small subunit ribosomal protein S6
MEKKLNAYETMYVVDASLSDEAIAAVVAKFTALANEHAVDVCVNEWGKRRLAYPIQYKTEGYYVLMNYKSEPSFPLEMERVLGITDGILRHMTTTSVGSVAPVVEAAPAEKVEEAPVVSEETATDAE